MTTAISAILAGAVLLFWSADRFVEGAAGTARHFGMSSLMIGMIIVGFGTSAPEMLVSAMASLQNNAGIALGNAFGSNIANIALILGLSSVISPISVHSRVLRRELPLLTLVTGLVIFLISDLTISRSNALVLLAVFLLVIVWTLRQGTAADADPLGTEISREMDVHSMPVRRALFWLFAGLILLIFSSRILVWGAVRIAEALGISDLVIGLTIVAVGTSLPELASSLVAAIKKEHDIALGNIIGSNIFNTLAVVGIAGSIRPLHGNPELLFRDMLLMGILTVSIFLLGYGYRRHGRINRVEGGILLCVYCVYVYILIRGVS
ncbi:calcium/sodium antiporter [Marispirochaeta aestuarii]|uniref:Calcium/sodium antiporter n=1 Tax=Marispirochaeta aestuarii TaxID=1963862 RepID=A0A1Y1S2Z8_9SPIO|nr:calcium/sodium antiporter [Marispirochaeta aestuarii]ORC37304.1 calcium/sodium antiporter [Marispirochaeta aestuarii]